MDKLIREYERKLKEQAIVDRWIQRADKLLYEGKNSGKNRVVM